MSAVSWNRVRNSETFPSQTELTVAKALLLLCSKPPQLINSLAPPPPIISYSTAAAAATATTTNHAQDRTIRKQNPNRKEEDLSPPSESKSCSSTLTSDSSSRLADRLQFLAVAARPRDLKLKIQLSSQSNNAKTKSTRSSYEDSSPTESIQCSSTVTSSEVSSSKVIRRRRSKYYYYRNSNRRENHSGMSRTKPFIETPGFQVIKDEPETSSMSNASSPSAVVHGDELNRSVVVVNDEPAPAIVRSSEVNRPAPAPALVRRGESKRSSGRKKNGGNDSGSGSGESKRQKVAASSAPYLIRRAEDIMQVLSTGCASEVRIREVVGNSPDTSKALRMLLKMEKVKRFGAGGHRDPYIYMVVESDSDVASD